MWTVIVIHIQHVTTDVVEVEKLLQLQLCVTDFNYLFFCCLLFLINEKNDRIPN